MRATVRKWGNSASVRIPRAVLEEAKLKVDQKVDVQVEAGAVVIRAVRREYDLADLVSQITPENLHPETDWGPPVGKEVW